MVTNNKSSSTLISFGATRRPIVKTELVAQNVAADESDLQMEEDEDEARLASIKQQLVSGKLMPKDEGSAVSRRKISMPVVVSSSSSSSISAGVAVKDETVANGEQGEEDEDENERRRARARARAKQQQLEEEAMTRMNDEEAASGSVTSATGTTVIPRRFGTLSFATIEAPKIAKDFESESEEEEEDDDDEEEEELLPHRPLIAPVFKKKSERETMSLEKVEEAEWAEQERRRQQELEKRAVDTKQLLQEQIKQNEIEQRQSSSLFKDPDELLGEADDDGDPNEEYEQWKLREFRRIKREREEKLSALQDKENLERRRQLSDKQIMEEDEDRLKPKEKASMAFLQKYYHKGAFCRTFDESDEMSNGKKWDFNEPVLEDKVDKSKLPKVLQVRRSDFGKAKRTRYTHLTDQDTTGKDNPWTQKEFQIDRLKRKMGGFGSVESSAKKQKS
jgi:microfibrillar-associated protein 1